VHGYTTGELALIALAASTTLLLAGAFVDFAIGFRGMRRLRDIVPASQPPSLSIVVAARNEARGIEPAIRSLLALDYPSLELFVVEDRSTDETGAILAALAREHPRLRLITITQLPEGWLGKNHALFAGAEQASGELLLFTDADVVFERTAVRRAVALLERNRLDHLAGIPDVEASGAPMNVFVAAFGVFFSAYSRPWKARDPRSACHIGIGAFNLVRASAYRAIGTHRAIAMRPDDDLKLGKLIKKHGLRQDVVLAGPLIVVEWYRSLREAIEGLTKNAFAGVDYSLLKVAAATLALLLINVWPFIGIFVTHGLARGLNAASAGLLAAIYVVSTTGWRRLSLFGYPLAALLFTYIMWRSALLAVVSGRISWRGTSYSLAAMRANRI
jgi:cellulose synthase/poly-beta-1,6-N-acetylglucosamine synthase-like glycosyltransferase